MKRSLHPILIALLTLVAFNLRVIRLDFQPLWWDEGYSVFFATRDLATMLERTAIDIHPPLYYALMQVWILITGKTDTALRMMSVLIGIATLPLIYLLALKLFKRTRIAFITALLLAISPLHIYYSQELRMYGLVTFLTLLSTLLLAQLLTMPVGKPKTAFVVLMYIGVSTAALYTQYYAAFVIAFQIVLVLWHLWKSKITLRFTFPDVLNNPLVHWFSAWFSIAVLYLPWVVYAGGKLYAYVSAKVSIEKYPPLDPITFLGNHFSAFSVGHISSWNWLAWASAFLIILAIVGLLTMTRRQDEQRTKTSHLVSQSPYLLVSLYLLVPLTFAYLVNLIYPFHPIHNERLLLLVLPAFMVFVALGIDHLWHHRAILGTLAIVLVAIVSALSLYDFYTVPRYSNDDYRPLIAEMQKIAQPNDIFLAIYPWQIGYLESYYSGATLNMIETPNDAWMKNAPHMRQELDALLAKQKRVWIPALQTQGRILEDALDADLRARAYAVFDNWFGTTRLEFFALADDAPASNSPIPITLGASQFSLDNWGISTNTVASGQDLVRVWFNISNLPNGLKASFRIVDANNNSWLLDDREITRGMQRIGLQIPVGTPPTQYTLRLRVYNDTQSSDEIKLASVTVIAPSQPNSAAVPHHTSIDLGNGVRFVGYDLPNGTLQTGVAIPITLFWQSARAIDTDFAVELDVQDDSGKSYATSQAAPANGIYSTSKWAPNEIVRDPQSFTLRGDTPDGDYRIGATFFDPVKNLRAKSAIVGTITVQNRPRYFGAPTPSHIVNAQFGDVAKLVGYDASIQGNKIKLILWWQSLGTTPTLYKVFVHAIDANGNIRAQNDQIPGNGTLPTTSWVKGEYLGDLNELNAPNGEYRLRIGLYDLKTNARLPVINASNQPLGDYIDFSTRITVP